MTKRWNDTNAETCIIIITWLLDLVDVRVPSEADACVRDDFQNLIIFWTVSFVSTEFIAFPTQFENKSNFER